MTQQGWNTIPQALQHINEALRDGTEHLNEALGAIVKKLDELDDTVSRLVTEKQPLHEEDSVSQKEFTGLKEAVDEAYKIHCSNDAPVEKFKSALHKYGHTEFGDYNPVLRQEIIDYCDIGVVCYGAYRGDRCDYCTAHLFLSRKIADDYHTQLRSQEEDDEHAEVHAPPPPKKKKKRTPVEADE